MSEIICSGGLFYAKSTKRFLFLHRKLKQKGTWGMVGGKSIDTETPWQSLQREITEEVGFAPTITKTIPLDFFVSKDSRFKFHTYVCVVEQEFMPKLNEEHSGYAWVSMNTWPLPLHEGVRKTLLNRNIKTKLQTILDLIV